MTFVLYALPPTFVYFVIAVLTITRRTHTLRVVLWPVVIALALLALAALDLSVVDRDHRWYNTIYIFLMVCVVTRTLDWTIPKEPLVRQVRPTKASPSIVMDALDLALTLRGHGWDWSRGVYIPRETRPMDRIGFTLHVTLSAVIHVFVCGVLHISLRSFSPKIGGNGGSVFDETLPPHVQYVRGSIISACALFGIYAFIQVCYDACTLVGILVFDQEPAQWPPAFDAPWRATSISDFWGRRWHQFFRRTFLVQGGFPLSLLFGRTGLVFGAFLSSGVLHHAAMVMLDHQLPAWILLVGFGMMAPVVLAEIAFKRLTGRKVGGVLGWVWMMVWMVVLGNMIIDGFARAGMFGRLKFTENVVPRRDVVERLVTRFDCWLRTI